MPRRFPVQMGIDFCAHLAFFSRLPAGSGAAPDFSQAWWALPAVGLLLGSLAGLGAAVAMLLGMSPFVAGICAVLIAVGLSGALHEDGLADCCDALGGGSREKRLVILRDSRIGTFGALALFFSVLLRSAALADILASGAIAAIAALAGAGAVSRAAALAPLALLPAARDDGLGAAAAEGNPSFSRSFLVGSVIAGVVIGPLHPIGTAVGLACALAATLGVVALARRLLGGQTGDVSGAAVQAAEIVFLLGLATLMPE